MIFMLTNNCNLRCPMCGHSSHNNGEAMPFDKYISLLDEIKKTPDMWEKHKWVRLDGNREPLLYGKLIQAIQEAKKRSFYVNLITNGILLSKQTSDLLIGRKVDAINISITGISSNVYRYFQGAGGGIEKTGEQLNRVINNVAYLSEQRTFRAPKMHIRISFIVTSQSVKEVRKAFEFWKKIGVNEFQITQDSNTAFNPETEVRRRIYRSSKTCLSSLVIASNGDVFPCCMPAGEGVVLGNCFEKNLNGVFQSDRFRSFFESLSTLDFYKIPQSCRNCFQIVYEAQSSS